MILYTPPGHQLWQYIFDFLFFYLIFFFKLIATRAITLFTCQCYKSDRPSHMWRSGWSDMNRVKQLAVANQWLESQWSNGWRRSHCHQWPSVKATCDFIILMYLTSLALSSFHNINILFDKNLCLTAWIKLKLLTTIKVQFEGHPLMSFCKLYCSYLCTALL